MSSLRTVYVVQEWNNAYDVVGIHLSNLRSPVYYDWDAEENVRDPIEFAIDNPDQSLEYVIEVDPDEGESIVMVEVFSTQKRAKEWSRLKKMRPTRNERMDAPYLWRQRVGFCD